MAFTEFQHPVFLNKDNVHNSAIIGWHWPWNRRKPSV